MHFTDVVLAGRRSPVTPAIKDTIKTAVRGADRAVRLGALSVRVDLWMSSVHV